MNNRLNVAKAKVPCPRMAPGLCPPCAYAAGWHPRFKRLFNQRKALPTWQSLLPGLVHTGKHRLLHILGVGASCSGVLMNAARCCYVLRRVG